MLRVKLGRKRNLVASRRGHSPRTRSRRGHYVAEIRNRDDSSRAGLRLSDEEGLEIADCGTFEEQRVKENIKAKLLLEPS